MLICVFEDSGVFDLYPLTRTRAAFELRAGHRTILECIAGRLPDSRLVVHCRPEIADVVAAETGRLVNRIADGVDVLFVNGRMAVARADLFRHILKAAGTPDPQVFRSGDDVVAAWMPATSNPSRLVSAPVLNRESFEGLPADELQDTPLVGRIWHLLPHISAAISDDFDALSHGINIFERPDARISERADLVSGEHIYIGPGAEVRSGAVLDASRGPVIIDRDAVIMENAVLRGPVSIGEHSIVKVGASLDACTIGPWSKVAGEVHESVVHSFSNKSHAGYLGNSYLGSWVNLGADTNTSNLKNDYGIVSAFNESTGEMEQTGGIFAGLVMGDHSKCGISSMFNTGTVVGVCCNLFGSGYHPRYVPSFLWGSPQDGFVPYRLDKALRVAAAVMKRRHRELTPAVRDLLTSIHADTEPDRARGPER